MNKLIKFISRVLVALLFAGLSLTGCYDDSGLYEKIGGLSDQLQDHESRIKELEALCKKQNTNIESLKTIVDALKDRDYVTNVAPITEGGNIIGYTITFSKSGSVTIYNGEDGYVPVLGVKQDTDGQWYWIIDGDWMTDIAGNKVRASAIDGEDGEDGAAGEDGITPKLKIEDDYWYVSYDNGQTWERYAPATGEKGDKGDQGEKGDSMFKEVTYDADYVYLTLSNGTKLTVPRSKSYSGENVVGPATVVLSRATTTSATFTGNLDLPENLRPYTQVAVYYSKAENFNIHDAESVHTTTFNENGDFTLVVNSLDYGKTYSYCVVVTVKQEQYYGEIIEFTTAVLPDLKLEDIKTEVDVMTVSITGKIVGIEDVDISEVDLTCSFSDYLYVVCDQISANGEFRFVFEVCCREALAHNRKYSGLLRISYDGYTIDEQSVDIQTYIPKGSVNLSSVSYDSAVFTGVIDDFAELSQCPSNTSDSKMQAGIYYSTDPNVEPSKAKKAQGTLNDDGTFTVALDNLLPDTRYYYGLVIVHNGGLYGEIQEFTTTDFSVFSDLSSGGSANCYIVSEVGLYKFKPVKGNSSESVGAVSSAEVLWESFGTSTVPSVGDLVKSVSYSDGYISFRTADTFKEGNAVIAAKDAEGNILWSWHIWFTDQPQEPVYYNNAGTMMDRNLGATSATPGDVGALGLLYQWGRKDPFLGSSSISSDSVAKSTIEWPSAVSSNSSRGTIEYATANPTTFITRNTSNDDWYYTGDSSTDNTRWTTSESNKSIYDPCPSGWRVPDGGASGVWSTASGSSLSFNYTYSTNRGMNFSGKFGNGQTIWYPGSGFRSSGDGSLSIVGLHGFYWSASPRNDRAYGLYVDNYGNVYLSYYDYRAYGYSVRCLQVIDEVAGANAEE